MKKLIAMCLLAVPAWGAPLPLSSTFEIRPREAQVRWSYLPTLKSWRSESTWNNEKFAITVIHMKPPAFANSVSVDKQWAEQTHRTPTTSKVLEDKKCKRSGRVHFVCERTVNENNLMLADEKIFWNENSDLVLVRVSTSKNREALAKFSELMDVKVASRLPASLPTKKSAPSKHASPSRQKHTGGVNK